MAHTNAIKENVLYVILFNLLFILMATKVGAQISNIGNDTTICGGTDYTLNVSYTNTCKNLPTNLQNGLVSYYPFCGNANDESVNTHDGLVSGASLDADRFSKPNRDYTFDGNNDYIDISSVKGQLKSDSGVTIGIWFKSNWQQNGNFWENVIFGVNTNSTVENVFRIGV